jgi:hypothetical protein
MSRILLVAAAALSLTAALARAVPPEWNEGDWCRSWDNDDRVHACEIRTLTLPSVPAVLHVAPGQNGGVEVAAGAPGVVTVRARVYAWGGTKAEADAALAAVRITQDGGVLGSSGPATDSGEPWRSGWSVSFRIEAPAATALDLRANNGPVGVYEMTGRMELRTTNGPLAITRCGGDIDARTQNGPVAVALSGSRWVGRGLSARAVNGPAALTIPRNYDANLEFGTLRGPWSGPRPTDDADDDDGWVHVRLGKGGAPIAVTTQNGPFALSHGD